VSLLREQLTQERDVTQQVAVWSPACSCVSLIEYDVGHAQLEARCSELSTAVASLETQVSVARQEATEAKDTCSAEVSVYKTELLELQLELDKADAERTRVQAALTACEASLEATKQQIERWSAQCKLLTSEVQRLSLVSEEQSEALAGAQETVKLQQSLLEEADERDSAMRVEVSEAQSQLLSIRVGYCAVLWSSVLHGSRACACSANWN
jgi:chromosome segregation ATPase